MLLTSKEGGPRQEDYGHDVFRNRIEQFMRNFYGDSFLKVSEKDLGAYRLFSEGNKELCLIFDDRLKEVHSFIQNIKDVSDIEGSMTRLYILAQEEMQRYASFKHEQFTYFFISEHPKMIAWARTKGNEVFHWSSEVKVSSSDDGNDGYCFTRIFTPEDFSS